VDKTKKSARTLCCYARLFFYGLCSLQNAVRGWNGSAMGNDGKWSRQRLRAFKRQYSTMGQQGKEVMLL
jgi:hypothetical protein